VPQPLHSIEQGMFVRSYAGLSPLPSVVWLHGLGESGLCFEVTLRRRELSDWQHIVVDLPGYGRSAWPELPLRFEEQIDRLADWLLGRGDSKIILIGHSMGGVVAQLFCEKHPELILAMVDIEGNLSSGDCVFSGEAARQTESDFVTGGFDLLRDRVFRAASKDRALRTYFVSLKLADPRSFYVHSCELVELSATEKLARRLADLPMPALYMAGTPGGACARSVKLLAETDQPWVGISQSAHWPFIDRPEAFCEALRDFLQSASAGCDWTPK
jgi:pimeloyl-ACP methyl ester carboxylesterase